jgi:hypothetical protein
LTKNDEDAPTPRRQKKFISLFHTYTQVEPLVDKASESNVSSWWQAQVDYGAFWTKQMNPVINDEILVNVTELCSLVIHRTIENGEFLMQLQLVAAAWVEEEEAAFSDQTAVPFFYEQQQADDIVFYAVSPLGDKSNWDVTTGASTTTAKPSTTHPDSLFLSFGTLQMVWIVLVSVDPTLGYHFMVRLR